MTAHDALSYLFLLLLVVGVGAVMFGIYMRVTQVGPQFDSYEQYRAEQEAADAEASRPASGGLRRLMGRLGNRAARNKSRAARTAERLEQADIDLRVSEWYGIRIALPVAVGAVVFLVHSNFLAPLVFALICALLPTLYVRFRLGRRVRAVEGQLPDVFDLMISSLMGGQSIQQSVETIQKAAPMPVQQEFRRVSAEIRLGRTLSEALDHFADRVVSKDVSMFVAAVQIAQGSGSGPAEVLKSINSTVRDRQQIKGEVRMLTAQARASMYIIMGLPVALVALLMLLAPSYETPLVTTVGGYIVIGISAGLMGIAYVIIRKITAIEL